MLPKRDSRQKHVFKLSNNKEIEIKGWLVKHEQEFMYATEGLEDDNKKLEYIKTLISNCVPDDFDLDSLSEVEYYRLIIELRKISKGSEHEIVFTCPYCDTLNTDKFLNLDEDVEYVPFIKTSVNINNTIFNLKEVDLKTKNKIDKLKTDVEKRFEYLVNSIESIIVDDVIHANLSTQEIKEFLENEITPEEFTKLKLETSKNISGISVNKIFECDKCKKNVHIYVGNILDFFD